MNSKEKELKKLLDKQMPKFKKQIRKDDKLFEKVRKRNKKDDAGARERLMQNIYKNRLKRQAKLRDYWQQHRPSGPTL